MGATVDSYMVLLLLGGPDPADGATSVATAWESLSHRREKVGVFQAPTFLMGWFLSLSSVPTASHDIIFWPLTPFHEDRSRCSENGG